MSGISLRDHFAGLAMKLTQDMIDDFLDDGDIVSMDQMTKIAYSMADAMLSERAKTTSALSPSASSGSELPVFVVVDKNGEDPLTYTTEAAAREAVDHYDERYPKLGPHRIFRLGEEVPR